MREFMQPAHRTTRKGNQVFASDTPISENGKEVGRVGHRSDLRRLVGEVALERSEQKGAGVRVTGVITNLPVADMDAARTFYADYLGLSVEELNLGWVKRYVSPDGRASVQLVTKDATSPADSVMSVQVGDDIDDAYAEAQRRGYQIVHPLTEEPWGLRRFLLRDPDGNVINITNHRNQ
jgi:predicted enzyme related to lactoylglutathione lyase